MNILIIMIIIAIIYGLWHHAKHRDDNKPFDPNDYRLQNQQRFDNQTRYQDSMPQPKVVTPDLEPEPVPEADVQSEIYPSFQTVSPQQFDAMFQSRNQITNPGGIVIGQITKNRVHGAMADLTPNILRQRMALINTQQINRSDDLRKQAYVPGYDDVKNDWVNEQPMWHRTHLVPFRMTLSEGNDHPGLLMTATSYLNMGMRPEQNYYPDVDEQDYRAKKLYQMYQPNPNANRQEWFLWLSSPKQITANYKYHVNYSLDDIERLVCHIILTFQNPNASFRYQVRPLYDNADSQHPEIPTQVQAQLIDQTHHHLLVNVVLPNIK